MNTSRIAALLALGVAFTGNSFAGSEPAAPAPASGILTGRLGEGSGLDRLWSVPTLYKNPQHSVVQELAVIGQLQTQYAYGSTDSGNFGTQDVPDPLTWGNIEVRRFRLGLKGRLFKKLTFLNLTDLHPDLSPRYYKRTPETYFTWAENEALNISAGKTELKFDREQEYSSRDFPAFERSAVGHMLYFGELTGAWVCGSGIGSGWLYYLGAYSNDRVDEVSHFTGGTILLSKIGYDYTPRTSFDLAQVKLQYLHNSDSGHAASPGDLPSPSYSDAISLSNEITDGRFGQTTEFLWGNGALGRPDVFALSSMVTWSFTEKLQFVNTLEAAGSTEENGVFLPARYEALAPGAGDRRGDAYFAAFAGLNYYLRGHNLKLMSGVKYTHMHGGDSGGDFDGWTGMAGVRIAF